MYRVDDGQYVVQLINRTSRQNEQDQFATVVCEDVPDLLRALVRQNIRFAAVARQALHGAAQNDETIAECERRRVRNDLRGAARSDQ
jgi:predicted FMN-binding regulatory protein PaiB